MIYCKELNENFGTKAEMFKALRENKDAIIASKKAQVFKSCEKGQSVNAKVLDPLKLDTQVKGVKVDPDFYYIAENTTRILDSHRDVHTDEVWNKTVKDQQGKNYLVADHDLSINSTIARKEDIEMFVASIPFSLLGMSYSGDTNALIYKVRKDKVIHQKAKEWLDSGADIEASVRMQYVKILFCLNSEEEEDKEFKANFQQYYKIIANKEEWEGLEYFWAVTQAKNLHESSLVLFGSNSATGQITDNKTHQPSNDTEKNEPSNDTQIIETIKNYTSKI